jgi:endonuclease G
MSRQSTSNGGFESAHLEAIKQFGHLRHVTGIDIGPKYRGKDATGIPLNTGIPSIRLHVVHKELDRSRLLPTDIFPEEIGGAPVDVLERVYVPAVEGRTGAADVGATPGAGRFSPLQPGISISHRLCPSGTLGLLVKDDLAEGELSVLTNWHILADSSFANPGDPITQPSAMDGGRPPGDTVAHLTRSILDQDGDAAIAKLTHNRPIDLTIRDLGAVARTIKDPVLGDIVVKSGRSTNVTKGRVEGRGVYFPIYRTKDRIGIAGFEIVPLDRSNPTNIALSANGDSGAVWLLEDSDTVVGLHFAGERNVSPDKEVAIACFATRVFSRLGISLTAESISHDAMGHESHRRLLEHRK